jgi:hypothetical protein
MNASKIAEELRTSWQAKVLARTGGHLNAVVMSVLAHSFDEAMPVLLRVVYPGFESISAPFYCSAAKINKFGVVVADVVTKTGEIVKDSPVFENERLMREMFAALADRIQLADADRKQLYACVNRWIVADQRLDPTFDPRDPDARRLALN